MAAVGPVSRLRSTRGKDETRHSNGAAELRRQLAAISVERNEPRPLSVAGAADNHDTVSHRESPDPYGVKLAADELRVGFNNKPAAGHSS